MLRTGICIGMAIIIAGLVMSFMDMGDTVLYIGILILIVSPLLGVVVSFIALLKERDLKWAGAAAILLIVTAIGILISY